MANSRGFSIGRIFGIPIYIDPSWILIFLMITWSLALQFTQQHPQWTPVQHWTLGILTSLLFFASILFHELSHSMVARHYKIDVSSITLFVFGGVSRIGREAPTAFQEFNIAVAGPLSSTFLSAVFYLIARFYHSNDMITALATWLSGINLVLALFNLLPGFPLDGGRVFRAIVWGITKNFQRATRAAGAAGKLVAYGMIVFGGWDALHGQWIAGLWLVFIGFFLLNAAHQSVAQTALRDALAGLRAADIMSQEVPTVTRDITLEDYAHEVLRTGRRWHLVTTGDQLVGMISVHKLNSVPRDRWADNSVQAVMVPRDKILWASPEEPVPNLLERLLSSDVNQMPVVSSDSERNTHIVGMITRDSILRIMQAHTELGSFKTGR